MHQDTTSPSDEVALNRCQDLPPVPVLTTVAQVGAQETLYVATYGQLYAVNASDGTVRWCQQLTLTREYGYQPGVSYPPPPHMLFGTPRVVNGVVYVCASGSGRYTYALNEQDGTVLRRIAFDTRWLSPQALVEDTIYAMSQMGVYAINAQNGEVYWLYQPDAPTIMSGPLVVADHLLYAGTSGSVDHPEKSYFCALDAEKGTERWRYTMGSYIGAVIHNERVYVSSGDRCLYALDKHNGSLRWKYQFVSPGHYPATIAENVLYINTDGAYALSSTDGAVLWHQHLGSSPS